jgi:gliding motility-associated-like protein
MKKLLSCLFILFAFTLSVKADHITGGEIFYTYAKQVIAGDGTVYNRYYITLKLFRDCNSTGAQLDAVAAISVFSKSGGPSINLNVKRSKIVTLNLGTPDPCILNPPTVCYQVGYYEDSVDLVVSPNGYIIAYQRCCRIAGINNISNSNSSGATYTAEIPGSSNEPTGPINNSARFVGEDTVIVCANNAFKYSFAAVDDDNDQLSYSFCGAYPGGSRGTPQPSPPAPPPYFPLTYTGFFSGTSPLGSGVKINPATGLIEGVAPAVGIYVVTVCVNEIRNGVVIATQRKDLQIKVGDCKLAAAALDPQYITCDGFDFTFANNPPNNPLVKTYFWDFGIAARDDDTSNLATPTFNYAPAPGIYTVKLVTNRNLACSDSTTTKLKVFPGFFPDFDITGICITKPTLFKDKSTTLNGNIDSWRWDFGETTATNDTSRNQNPSYTYPGLGNKTVTFTVSSNLGCSKTITKEITIIDKPPISMAFRDTLICKGDNLQLQASGPGVFSWTPLSNIINDNTGTPTVNPNVTTIYRTQLNIDGCINNDSVRVRVVDFVTLRANNDTTICQGDAVQLGATSDGLRFLWTSLPAAPIDRPTIINPIATSTTTNTTYTITATIGGCNANRDIRVTTVPYPVVNAGPDVTICFNGSTQLNGSTDGTSFTWSSPALLSDPNRLDPVATPPRTRDFVLTAIKEGSGCPKPSSDIVTVTVLPKIVLRLASDTAIVLGQPLLLNAEGAENYLWTPTTGFLGGNDGSPVTTIIPDGIDSIRYKVYGFINNGKCVDSTTILVKVFKTSPSIFIPSGFTPNGDGKNDLFRPIAAGIAKIEYFRVFNRWGQLVFSTSINGQGWDGRIGGKEQSSNTYVWIVKAIDYLGRPYFRKGTVTLIR